MAQTQTQTVQTQSFPVPLVQRMDEIDARRKASGRPLLFCPSLRICILTAADSLSDQHLEAILQAAEFDTEIPVLGEVA